MGCSIIDLNKNEFINMSNGSTSVFIELLLLAGTDLATNLWEKELMVWLAENDQTFRSIGCVGFDVSEMGWTKENFALEKEFVIKVIDSVLNKTNWNKLNYTPHEGIALENFDKFKNMIQNYEFDTNNLKTREWHFNPPPNSDFKKCPKHQIFLYYIESLEDECCVICNNMAI